MRQMFKSSEYNFNTVRDESLQETRSSHDPKRITPSCWCSYLSSQSCDSRSAKINSNNKNNNNYAVKSISQCSHQTSARVICVTCVMVAPDVRRPGVNISETAHHFSSDYHDVEINSCVEPKSISACTKHWALWSQKDHIRFQIWQPTTESEAVMSTDTLNVDSWKMISCALERNPVSLVQSGHFRLTSLIKKVFPSQKCPHTMPFVNT